MLSQDEAITTRRIALLQEEAQTAPHGDGALVVDETGVRKHWTYAAHVGDHYLA
jgi:hypothetical protein